MNPLLIAQLIIALGPPALGLIQDLIAVWSKPTLTPDEVNTILEKAKKSYEQYKAEAQQAS